MHPILFIDSLLGMVGSSSIATARHKQAISSNAGFALLNERYCFHIFGRVSIASDTIKSMVTHFGHVETRRTWLAMQCSAAGWQALR